MLVPWLEKNMAGEGGQETSPCVDPEAEDVTIQLSDLIIHKDTALAFWEKD